MEADEVARVAEANERDLAQVRVTAKGSLRSPKRRLGEEIKWDVLHGLYQRLVPSD